MTMIVSQTKVMVLNGSQHSTAVTYYRALNTINSFRQLGVEVPCRTGLTMAHSVVCNAAIKAMWGMTQQGGIGIQALH